MKKEKIAVIKIGGKQYLVKPGEKIKVEKVETEEGKKEKISEVLLVAEKDKVEIGQPFCKKEVEYKVIQHGKGEKVKIVKFKPKKGYKKVKGHRQPFTEIEIVSIK